jgi:hypothetical protein
MTTRCCATPGERLHTLAISQLAGARYERIEGPDHHRDATELRHQLRIIDREGNRYRKLIVRPNGAVVVDVDEPLDQHTGHGSAKGRKS